MSIPDFSGLLEDFNETGLLDFELLAAFLLPERPKLPSSLASGLLSPESLALAD